MAIRFRRHSFAPAKPASGLRRPGQPAKTSRVEQPEFELRRGARGRAQRAVAKLLEAGLVKETRAAFDGQAALAHR